MPGTRYQDYENNPKNNGWAWVVGPSFVIGMLLFALGLRGCNDKSAGCNDCKEPKVEINPVFNNNNANGDVNKGGTVYYNEVKKDVKPTSRSTSKSVSKQKSNPATSVSTSTVGGSAAASASAGGNSAAATSAVSGNGSAASAAAAASGNGGASASASAVVILQQQPKSEPEIEVTIQKTYETVSLSRAARCYQRPTPTNPRSY